MFNSSPCFRYIGATFCQPSSPWAAAVAAEEAEFAAEMKDKQFEKQKQEQEQEQECQELVAMRV
jgi:hypothetical protein